MKFKVWTLTAMITIALHVSAFAVDKGYAQEGSTQESSVLGGTTSGFLRKSNSPYLVKETVVIPEEKALVIEAGVELRFAEGTGLDVRGGSMVVLGDAGNPVTFSGATGLWNGVSITGLKRSEVQGLQLTNAEYGFVVESGALEMRDVVLDGVVKAAVYVRNGSVDIQWSKIIGSNNVGLWATQSAAVNVNASSFENNHIAAVVTDGSEVTFQSSSIKNNEIAILDYSDNRLTVRNTAIQSNKFGLVSNEVPAEDVKRAIKGNKKDMDKNFDVVVETLGEEPRNPYADGMKLVVYKKSNSSDSLWKHSGNLGMSFGYHGVQTRHHHSSTPYEFDGNIVKDGELYTNYFQVPGFYTNWNANILVESFDGRTFEFNADISNDEWDKFAVHSIQAIYTDRYQRVALGDVTMNAGALYLEGINFLGGTYDLNIFLNSPKTPMFQISAFGGEYRAPKLQGEKNYDIYNDRIGVGEAETQELVAGGKVRWNMHTRFNGTLGFIGSKDFKEDPLLRDGMSSSVNTSTPVLTTHNFFADGEWLVFPGDIKLNGQVAVGTADTANAGKIRAINQVFTNAGLNTSNFSLLNKLMNAPSAIDTLSNASLESIFGDNTMMTKTQKIQRLRELLAEAKQVASEYVEEDAQPTHKKFWEYPNWAVAGSYEWSSNRTFIEGFLRYVGSGYYSAGSPDMLQNTRRVGGNLRQKIADFWNLSFGYSMNVENAQNTKHGYNIFGMAEFSQWGLFSTADKDSLEKHEQDAIRTLYIHDAYLGNEFKITDKIGLGLKYAVNYRTRSTAQRMYGNYAAESGIYNDPWFAVRKGKDAIKTDSVEVDREHWQIYKEMQDAEYLATQFEERILKQTADLALTFKLPNNVLRLGGRLVFRNDFSRFVNDTLIKELDFTDETFGILGYYFHGGDYIEQLYALSLNTRVGDLRNLFAFNPRYKIYNRNEMREFEWAVSDNLSFPISREFLDLSLNGAVRQNFLNYEEGKNKVKETELDVTGSATLTIHHTPSLKSDWTVGAICNYRPQSRQDEYKDIYGSISLNYEF